MNEPVWHWVAGMWIAPGQAPRLKVWSGIVLCEQCLIAYCREHFTPRLR